MAPAPGLTLGRSRPRHSNVGLGASTSLLPDFTSTSQAVFHHWRLLLTSAVFGLHEYDAPVKRRTYATKTPLSLVRLSFVHPPLSTAAILYLHGSSLCMFRHCHCSTLWLRPPLPSLCSHHPYIYSSQLRAKMPSLLVLPLRVRLSTIPTLELESPTFISRPVLCKILNQHVGTNGCWLGPVVLTPCASRLFDCLPAGSDDSLSRKLRRPSLVLRAISPLQIRTTRLLHLPR